MLLQHKTSLWGGGNLTADISAAVSGADASLFTISPSSLAQTSGTASGTITVTYSPTAVGNHAATLTLTSTGATDVTVALTGAAALATPTATASTGGTATGFTANWNAVAGATSYTLNVYTKESSGTLPTDLFISEYGEGSSYNKFIELYNGTGADVDLSNYSLKKESNGGGTFGSELTLSGTLANGATYVICNNSAGTTLKAKANLVTNSASTGFNGNDAIGLFKSGTMIDIVGVAGSSAYWGQDKGFIRNANATAPSTTFNASADWTETAKDAWDNVGTHTMTGGTTDTPITGSPFTATGATSKVLTGLDSTKDYYYTVVASDGTNTSAVSNEIQGVLVATSVETNTANSTHIYATNGAIQFEVVESGLQVEVYNSLGQRVISTTTVQGLNTIQVNKRGVLVVRVGKELQKVIL